MATLTSGINPELSSAQRILNKNCEATLRLQRGNYAEANAILRECLRDDLPDVETRAFLYRLLEQHHLQQQQQEQGAWLRRDAVNDSFVRPATARQQVGTARDRFFDLDDDEDEDADDQEEEEEEEGDNMEEGYLLDDDDDEEEGFPQANNQVGVTNVASMTSYSVPINVGSKQVDESKFYNSQGGFCFFSEAILTSSLQANDGDYHPQFVQAILLYNLALSFHQEAILPRDRLYIPFLYSQQEHPIDTACRFYNLAATALEQVCHSPLSLKRIQHEDIALVFVAIYNNLAHIHGCYKADYPLARYCVQRIRDILAETQDPQASPILPLPLPRPFYNSDTWKFFFHNCVCVPPSFCTVSGAA